MFRINETGSSIINRQLKPARSLFEILSILLAVRLIIFLLFWFITEFLAADGRLAGHLAALVDLAFVIGTPDAQAAVADGRESGVAVCVLEERLNGVRLFFKH